MQHFTPVLTVDHPNWHLLSEMTPTFPKYVAKRFSQKHDRALELYSVIYKIIPVFSLHIFIVCFIIFTMFLYTFVSYFNLIWDRTNFRWEKLAFNYKKRYAVFSEARSRTVNILLMPTNPNITELIQYPILKTGPRNGKRIRYGKKLAVTCHMLPNKSHTYLRLDDTWVLPGSNSLRYSEQCA